MPRDATSARGGIAPWLVAALLVATSGAEAAVCERRDAGLLPVLELYTSEGCSSCPPADRRLAELVGEGIGEVLVPLAFHVDYWDYLGWRDRFADPRHEQRQRARVSAAGGRVVYTPQWMLGDAVQLGARDLDRVGSLATALREQAPAVQARLLARRASGALLVDLDARLQPGEAPLQAWLLRWSSGLSSEVSAGENRSRRLQHVRVVRGWQGPWPLGPGQPLSGLSRFETESERGDEEGLSLLLAADAASPAWALDLSLAGCLEPTSPD